MTTAIRVLRREIGDGPIHVICQCLGSVSFCMSLFGRAITSIASVITNSVALTPYVRAWSEVKIVIAPFVIESVLSVRYMNSQWCDDPGGPLYGPTKSMLLFLVLQIPHTPAESTRSGSQHGSARPPGIQELEHTRKDVEVNVLAHEHVLVPVILEDMQLVPARHNGFEPLKAPDIGIAKNMIVTAKALRLASTALPRKYYASALQGPLR